MTGLRKLRIALLARWAFGISSGVERVLLEPLGIVGAGNEGVFDLKVLLDWARMDGDGGGDDVEVWVDGRSRVIRGIEAVRRMGRC